MRNPFVMLLAQQGSSPRIRDQDSSREATLTYLFRREIFRGYLSEVARVKRCDRNWNFLEEGSVR